MHLSWPSAWPPAARSRPGGTTLKQLIDGGLLRPGANILSVEYKATRTLGSLLTDGRIKAHIRGQDMFFESPSAFSIAVKRLLNPTRKADDGWKSIRVNGKVSEPITVAGSHEPWRPARQRYPRELSIQRILRAVDVCERAEGGCSTRLKL